MNRRQGDRPWVLGYSTGHNSAMCLLHGDEIVVAIQEERLIREKRAGFVGPNFNSLRYCLDTAGITLGDVDAVVGASCNDYAIGPQHPFEGFAGETSVIPHYLAHAYAAFATSGFTDAVILVVDGGGEFVSSLQERFPEELADAKFARYPRSDDDSIFEQPCEIVGIYRGSGARVELLEKHIGRFLIPHQAMPYFGSLGGMYSAVAELLFGDSLEAGKVMGLAPYGRHSVPVDDFLSISEDGVLEFSGAVSRRYADLTQPWPANEVQCRDLACSVQHALEYALDYFWKRCAQLGQSANCAYAGGVALNSVANEKLIGKRRFRDHYIMPAAEDNGTALGAAYYGLWNLTRRNSGQRLQRDRLGRVYGADEVRRAVRENPFVREVEVADVPAFAVDALIDQKIIGWFDGGSEFGPRALGQRSILCDPRRTDGKDILNRRVKHREPFRPFAPVILEEEAGNWFEVTGSGPESPFMLRVLTFRDEVRHRVPSVVHVDGTGRPQTVHRELDRRLYDLIASFFDRTGVPLLLNTSFNVMGEPIVETPQDALWCLLFSGLDYVCFTDLVVERNDHAAHPLDLPFRVEVEPEGLLRLPDGKVLLMNHCLWGPRCLLLQPDALTVMDSVERTTSGRPLLDRLADAEQGWTEARLTRALAALHRAGILKILPP